MRCALCGMDCGRWREKGVEGVQVRGTAEVIPSGDPRYSTIIDKSI